MMHELQKTYAAIPVPLNLKRDILEYCRVAKSESKTYVWWNSKSIALIAACAAMLFVALAVTLNLFGGGRLPVGSSEEAPEQSTVTQQGIFTTTRPDNTGGDEDACDKHVMFYHSIDGNLIDYIGSNKVHAHLEEKGWLNTSHLTKEEREEFTVLHFLKHFGVSKQEFITAMGWQDKLDEKPDSGGMFNDNFTYREQVDALYSDDQNLVDTVFAYDPPVVESTTTNTTAQSTVQETQPSSSVSLLKPIYGTTSTRLTQ